MTGLGGSLSPPERTPAPQPEAERKRAPLSARAYIRDDVTSGYVNQRNGRRAGDTSRRSIARTRANPARTGGEWHRRTRRVCRETM